MFPDDCLAAARALLDACKGRGLRLTTAESCTGGLIAGCLTEIAGSSTVVGRGYIVYDNRAKAEMLGVREGTLAEHGAVSAAVAMEMASGALARSGCDLAIAVTGIAGPGGGGPAKPVGLVHLAAARRTGEVAHERHVFAGDRSAIRLQTVRMALLIAAGLIEPTEVA
jgi:nicotinamide-nucleotide amidase